MKLMTKTNDTTHKSTLGQLASQVVGDPSKPRLVMLHGWGLHQGVFKGIEADLVNDYQLQLIDLPGFGQSQLADNFTEADYQLDNVLAKLDELIEPNSHLFGWSLGGLLALGLAERYPDKISSVYSLCSNPCFVERAHWPHAMPRVTMEKFAKQLAEDFEQTLARFLALQTLGSETSKADLKSLQQTLLTKGLPNTKALTAALNLLIEVDLLSALPKIQQPVTMAFGRLDALVPKTAANAIQNEHSHVQCHTFNKAAHAPFISHKTEFLDHLTCHLKAHSFRA
jgi:pimeloyl-[acyl-carrier protein] methyl ester esterase